MCVVHFNSFSLLSPSICVCLPTLSTVLQAKVHVFPTDVEGCFRRRCLRTPCQCLNNLTTPQPIVKGVFFPVHAKGQTNEFWEWNQCVPLRLLFTGHARKLVSKPWQKRLCVCVCGRTRTPLGERDSGWKMESFGKLSMQCELPTRDCANIVSRGTSPKRPNEPERFQ